LRMQTRICFGNFTFYVMVAHTQRLRGVVSTVDPDKHLHVLFFDIEGCSLEECEHQLRALQTKYDLSDIYILSDHEKSFHAYCFTVVPFKRYLHILCDPVLKNIDYSFIHWTVVRGEATLRTSKKKDRPRQQVVSVLYSYPVPIPEHLRELDYDTGIEKRGTSLTIINRKLKLATGRRTYGSVS